MANDHDDAVDDDLATARQGSKGATIYEVIRRDILTLALRPGEKVSEQVLSERYGVGKAPVRLALARLSQDGLIINRQRSGHNVSNITFDDIKDIYQIRQIILPATAYIAAGNATDGLKKAYNAISQIDSSLSTAESMFEFCIANRNFIVEIGRATGNEMLADCIAMQEDRCMRIQFFGARTLSRTHAAQGEYDKIWSAISAGDRDVARAATQEALTLSEQRIIAAFLKLPELRSMNLGDLLAS